MNPLDTSRYIIIGDCRALDSRKEKERSDTTSCKLSVEFLISLSPHDHYFDPYEMAFFVVV